VRQLNPGSSMYRQCIMSIDCFALYKVSRISFRVLVLGIVKGSGRDVQRF
jgi:hypothetical protein